MFWWFNSVSRTFTGPTSTPVIHAPSIFESVFQALSSKVDVNTKSIEDLHLSHLNFQKSVTASLESLHSKLDILRVHDSKIAKTMDFEFGALQEGMTTVAKAWEKEFVKLFFKLGSETQFLSKQLTQMQNKRSLPWHNKNDWIGDCTLEEITAPLPLPAIPPPSVFGLSAAEYRDKIFEWMAQRDGHAPSPGFFEKTFTYYGQPPATSSSSKDKGKGPATVDIDDD